MGWNEPFGRTPLDRAGDALVVAVRAWDERQSMSNIERVKRALARYDEEKAKQQRYAVVVETGRRSGW